VREASDTDPALRPAAYALLGLGSLAYFLFLFVWFLLPAFLTPVIEQLGLSNTQAGLVSGGVQATYVPLALVSGLVVDRVGASRALGGGLVILGAAHALRGVAPGFPALLGATLLLGVGGTAITFGLPKLVADLFPPDRTGTASSVYLVAASLGTAVAFALGRPYLEPLLGGWRPVFVWSGVLVVAYGLLWLVVSHLLWSRTDHFGSDDVGGFTLGSAREDVRTVLSHPQLRLLVVVGSMHLFLSHGTQTWLAASLESAGVAAGLAATVATVFVLARTTGTLSVPAISDRIGLRRPAIVGCGVLAGVGLTGLVVSGQVSLLVGAVLVAGLGLGGVAPLVRSVPIELDGIGPRLTATANGFVFTVGEVGGFAGPFLVGSLRDTTGSFAPGFGLLAAGGLVVVVAGYLMVEPADYSDDESASGTESGTSG
jgi:cyanate permease